MGVGGSGWEWVGVGGSGWEWMEVGESGWEWVGVDGSGWEWVGVGGSGWEWIGVVGHTFNKKYMKWKLSVLQNWKRKIWYWWWVLFHKLLLLFSDVCIKKPFTNRKKPKKQQLNLKLRKIVHTKDLVRWRIWHNCKQINVPWRSSIRTISEEEWNCANYFSETI